MYRYFMKIYFILVFVHTEKDEGGLGVGGFFFFSQKKTKKKQKWTRKSRKFEKMSHI